MTKLELMITNNELEARVIELEAKLKCAEREAMVMGLRCDDALDAGLVLQRKYDALEKAIEDEAAERPAIPYDTWYAMLHPTRGGEPDLRVLATTAGQRVVA